jgi:hypothetical protein
MQERGLVDEDWNDDLFSRETNGKASTVTPSISLSSSEVKNRPDNNGKGDSKKANKQKKDKVSGSGSSGSPSVADINAKSSAPAASESSDDELRKKLLNAPRRISKIEAAIGKYEEQLKKIEDDMLQVRSPA